MADYGGQAEKQRKEKREKRKEKREKRKEKREEDITGGVSIVE